MTTLEMEIALLEYLKIRQNILVPNVSWGMYLGRKFLHEIDLLKLSNSNYASEIEIKISKYDLLKDKHKKHNHFHNHIKYFWFAVPEELQDIALAEIPERAGLYVVVKKHNRYYVKIIKKAITNKKAVKWTDLERNKLMRLGTMRILTLKKNILKNKKL